MQIKKLREKDISPLYKIGLQEFRGELWFTKRFLKETIRTPGYYLGAFEGKKLVGGILARRFDRPKLWIFFFVVKKSKRKHGTGTKLLKKIEEKCSNGFPLIFVDLCDAQAEAKKFYLQKGFERIAKAKNWFGIGKTGVIYSKKVKN